jgi:hypothetical protein
VPGPPTRGPPVVIIDVLALERLSQLTARWRAG